MGRNSGACIHNIYEVIMENPENVEMIVGQENGKVFLRFQRPMEVVIFDPQNMIDVATAMTDAAFEARDGIKPVGDTLKSELIERHRITLTHRFAHMISAMRGDKKRSDGQMAKELIEAALKEIF